MIEGITAVASVLPETLRKEIFHLPANIKENVEEIRLRVSREPVLSMSGKELKISSDPVDSETIASVLMRASNNSIHSVSDKIAGGFITVSGGHRIGICGTAVIENGKVINIRNISSLNIRLARDLSGISDETYRQVMKQGEFSGLLIISPPGFGKTTVVRDFIRNLSTGKFGYPGKRVSVADERCEIAGAVEGGFAFKLGAATDVMSGCKKSLAMTMLLRAMNPEVIAADEIATQEDFEAIREVSACGVKILATCHAGDVEEVLRKPGYRQLVEDGIFPYVLEIENDKGKRKYSLKRMAD